ncbi:MAG: PQQ-like beta-propeller repeat protein [Phycisphaerales bacterium]|nr:PQQ-like beta-propeller repeat protein [Phycisphaerales bacterium]
MSHGRIALCRGFLLLAGVAPSAMAEDWPNFRGPRFDGKSVETGLKLAWTEPIPMLWEQKLGPAYSSFAVVGDRVYTCGQLEKQQTLVCLDAATGATKWQFPIEKEWVQNTWDGPRATPTVHEGKVYVVGAHGRLVCVSAEDGKLVWEKQFNHVPQWGYAGSVLIEGNLAVTSGGKDQGALLALDKSTGKEVWKAGDDPSGYATPYPFTFAGKRYIVSMTGASAMIVEAASGKLALHMPWKTAYDVNAASPIFHDGHLFLSSGYDTGCGVFKLEAKGEELAASEVWRSKVLLNKFQTCLLHEGKLYGSDQNSLACVDFMTGKEDWRMRGLKDGTLILVEGHLLFLGSDGTLKIAKASAEKFEPGTSAQVLAARCWTVSVLNNGRLFARDNVDRVVCFDLKAK